MLYVFCLRVVVLGEEVLVVLEGAFTLDFCCCLTLCCEWGLTLPLPSDSWNRLQQTPVTMSSGISRFWKDMDGWMDGWSGIGFVLFLFVCFFCLTGISVCLFMVYLQVLEEYFFGVSSLG